MKQNKTFFLILALFLQILFFICLCSIESIFFSPRNSFIEIDLWIISLIFISLYRDLLTGVLFSLISPFFLSAFSGIPYHASILSFLAVLALIHAIKNRSFAQGPSYFSVCSFIAIISFYIFYFTISWILGDTSIQHPNIIKWLISALISPALFILIRPILILMDSSCGIKYPFGFEVEK